MHSKTTNVEAQKKTSQAKLDTRRALLKQKGLSMEAIRKDIIIRKIKAELRKSDFRLAAIAAQEEVSRRVEQAKADRLAAAQAPEKEPPQEIPVKKDKKAKKERPEKTAGSEGKKDKPEKQAEQSEAK